MPKVRMQDGTIIEVGTDALLADDGQTPLQIPTGQFFTAEDIQRARSEEKDKLYSRLEDNGKELTALREQVGSLTAAEQRREAQLEEERARLEAAARAEEEKGLDATALIQRKEQEWASQLQTMNQTWEQKFAEEQAQREAAAAALEKEREFNNLRDYAQSQVAAHENEIAPQLRQWITGNSQAEIDANIARAIETTNAITAEMQQALSGQVMPDPNNVAVVPGAQPVAPVLPGVRPTGGPGNTDPAAFTQQLTAEQIAAMPMDQYAALRGKIGIGGQGNNRGLFG